MVELNDHSLDPLVKDLEPGQLVWIDDFGGNPETWILIEPMWVIDDLRKDGYPPDAWRARSAKGVIKSLGTIWLEKHMRPRCDVPSKYTHELIETRELTEKLLKEMDERQPV